MIQLFRWIPATLLLLAGCTIQIEGPERVDPTRHSSGGSDRITQTSAPGERIGDIHEEEELEPAEQIHDITLGNPTGWIAVEIIEFDTSDVSAWIDATGYPAGMPPVVLVVLSDDGDVWGALGWRGVLAVLRPSDRLHAPAALADFVEGIEPATTEAVAASVAEIALSEPVYTDLVLEVSDGALIPVVETQIPGGIISVVLAGDLSVDFVTDTEFGQIEMF